VATLAAAFGLLFVARRAGGGFDALPTPPRPSASVAGSGAAAPVAAPGSQGAVRKAAPGTEVHMRLVDRAKDAVFEGHTQGAAQPALASYWRKMAPPWMAHTPETKRITTSIALRMSATETQWSMPTQGGKAWQPDARVWNMNEGSFDQRDALVTPTPSALMYRTDIPSSAKLCFAPGTVNANGEATLFVVEVQPPGGERKEISRTRVAPGDARKWSDDVCADLSAFAGQTVELRLRALTDPAAPGEKPPQAPRPRRAAAQDPEAAPAPAPSGDGMINIGGPSVALWGNPVILRQVPDTKVPYNVLFIVIDALRPDVIASFHDDQDDAAVARAPHAPLEAALPKVPGLVPHIDALAEKGVRFLHAYSGGAWTRPGTLSMLSGMRSSELGVGTLSWVIPQPEVARYYAQDPPLLPLLLRKESVATRAFVNNYFMVGYAPVGVDMGFERVDDHRFRTRDTLEITRDAIKWIRANKDQRFFAFCNYNSPHEPWEPPAEYLARVPPPPVGPKDRITRLYMAEAAKDDEAVGALMDTLKELSLLERTIVVLTADHGETLSAAHGGVGLDKMQIRYHHAVSNFEETTRIPILIVAPGVLPAGKAVKARVRNTDIVPTLLDLMGLEPNAKMSGKSVVKLARGERETDERVVVSEGRGTRGIMFGRHRLLLRDGAAQSAKAEDGTGGAPSDELFDLETDPGERINIAPKNPDLVKEMRARLQAAVANVAVAGSQAARSTAKTAAESDPRSKVQLRFVGAGASKRVSGKLKVSKGRFASIEAVGLDAAAARSDGISLDLAFTTQATAAVGFDVALDSPQAVIEWELFYDDQPLSPVHIHGGRYGLHFPQLARGLGTDDARAVAGATQLPEINAQRDYGLFVIRERKGGALDVAAVTGEGAEEMNRLLEEWGYASGPKKKK